MCIQKIKYSREDLFDTSRKLISKNNDFFVEITKNKHITLLKKILPSILGTVEYNPSFVTMLRATPIFHQLFSVIGEAHESNNYNISFSEENNIFLLKFSHKRDLNSNPQCNT